MLEGALSHVCTPQLSNVGCTLARGGVQPFSGENIFQPQRVRRALSIMLASGMYDLSGEWAFDVGFPAVSCVVLLDWVLTHHIRSVVPVAW
jgi:glutaminase